MFLALRPFRVAQGPGKPGLRCDAAGVWLGGVPLLRNDGEGWAPRTALEIDVLTKAAYGAAFDAERLVRGLAVASRALNEGDLGRAMVAALHLRLPELEADRVSRLRAADAALAKYSPDEPRDWHGRWTTGGAGSGAPGEAAEAERPALTHGQTRHSGQAGPRSAAAGQRSPSNDVGTSSTDSGNQPEPADAVSVASGPTGGRLIDVLDQEAGDDDGEPNIGDNGGPPLRPEPPFGAPLQPDPALPTPKVPRGWDQPYRVVNGKALPAGRYPTLSNGRPWPTAEPDEIYRLLDPNRGAQPFVKLYVPMDGRGPTLLGSTDTEEFVQPPGYEVVYLRGVPQRTFSRGAETAHARRSVEKALEFAGTNEYSDIFFNRSFSTISNGKYNVSYRPDVVGLRRSTLNGEYDVYEVLSPRQSGEAREQVLRPVVPGIRAFDSQAYKILLKLLRALGIG